MWLSEFFTNPGEGFPRKGCYEVAALVDNDYQTKRLIFEINPTTRTLVIKN